MLLVLARIGEPRRPTSRTLDFGEVVAGLTNLRNIFYKPRDPEPVPIAPPGEPQWKYNLKNQNSNRE